MLRAFRDDLDDDVLRGWLRREQAEDALDLLREMAGSGTEFTERELGEVWQSRYG